MGQRRPRPIEGDRSPRVGPRTNVDHALQPVRDVAVVAERRFGLGRLRRN